MMIALCLLFSSLTTGLIPVQHHGRVYVAGSSNAEFCVDLYHHIQGSYVGRCEEEQQQQQRNDNDNDNNNSCVPEASLQRGRGIAHRGAQGDAIVSAAMKGKQSTRRRP